MEVTKGCPELDTLNKDPKTASSSRKKERVATLSRKDYHFRMAYGLDLIL